MLLRAPLTLSLWLRSSPTDLAWLRFASQYWDRKRLESARHGRRLGETLSMSEWVLDVSLVSSYRAIFIVLHKTISTTRR